MRRILRSANCLTSGKRAEPPVDAASPVTIVKNYPVFKGVIDSPSGVPTARNPTYGTNNAQIFPAG